MTTKKVMIWRGIKITLEDLAIKIKEPDYNREWLIIVDDVEKLTGYTYEALTSKTRTGNLVEARQQLFYELHKAGFSYNEISKRTGKDRQTVAWGVKRHKQRKEIVYGKETK